MRLILCNELIWIKVILLFASVRLSYQTIYPCNASASCGCSMNSASLSRIVGGEAASSGTWSWAVSILIGGYYLCGGSIISSSWILTAAHCTYGYTAGDIRVYAGSNTKLTGTQIRQVSQLIMHQNYDPGTYSNDIALLQLNSPLSMNDSHVKTICLPSVSSAILSSGEWPPVNTTVIAVGWGALSESGSLPSNLQQVTLETVGYQAPTCSPMNINWTLQLCASVPGGAKDTCQGDSGGPLMMFSSNNQWILIGLTSNGIGCARPQYAGVYTRVAFYQDWINSHINGISITSTSTVSTSGSTTMSSVSISTAPSTTSDSLVLHATTNKIPFFKVIVFVLLDLIVAGLFMQT